MAAEARPEFYVMGVRNIARIAWDKVDHWLTAAWVGPGRRRNGPELGPAKYETATSITHAARQPRLALRLAWAIGSSYRDRRARPTRAC